MLFKHDLVIVGGCGRVGLPLALAFADRGLRVAIFDINGAAVDLVNVGRLPFDELGAGAVLDRVAGRNLIAFSDPAVIGDAETVIFVIGTPIDEHLNPDPEAVPHAIDQVAHHLRSGQLVVLRSTLYPGVTAMVERRLTARGVDVDVSFCPERIAEGKAMTELYELPQIVAGRSRSSIDRSRKLFSALTASVVELTPEEAELAKLFTNSWRYLKFAVANQFYAIANDRGLDYERVRRGLTYDYPRAADLPAAGLAAGPCLLKDTMQLAAFNNNQFSLGQSAMMVNEGLPLYVVDRMAKRWDLATMTVAILGMAFKGDSDDTRSSLSYKLRRILRFSAKRVLCADPYVTTDPDLVPFGTALAEADLIVVGAPHRLYHQLVTDKPVVDIWGIVDGGVKV
ncbi:MAG: nucleotide sugar dehydrogenase [Actinomycetota bacterium]|nr:nucleotide sugar dehydrogenase [Actinomycetota bacterium]